MAVAASSLPPPPPCCCLASTLLQTQVRRVYLPNPSARKFGKCLSQKKQESQEFVSERLFSNLNQSTLKREAPSLSSAVFLVAGTTVVAFSQYLQSPKNPDFWPLLLPASAAGLHGFLIAEVNVNTMSQLGSGSVSLVSMAMRTIGNVGVQIVCWTYIFIHYALLVAYVARSSEILTNFVGIPLWASATLFSLVLGGVCYFGSPRFIGAVNGVLAVASDYVQWNALLEANFQAVPMSIPIIVLSFVYQNVVPVLCTDLEGDLSRVRTSIVLGTMLKLPAGQRRPVLPYLLTLIPPVVLSLLDPDIFFKALDFAGTYGVLVPFGILPAAMSWSDRYSSSSVAAKLLQLVPGGRLTLSLVLGGAGYVIFSEIIDKLSNPQ